MGIEPTDKTFSDALRACLIALRQAYPALLDEIEQSLRGCFDLHGNSQEVASSLRKRAAVLQRYATEPVLALFVEEGQPTDATRDWREVLGRAVSRGKAPTHWNDSDVITFQAQLQRVASDFVRLEELALEQQHTGADQIIRVGILKDQLHEVRAVVAVTPQRAEAVEELVADLSRVMEQAKGEHLPQESRMIRVAALARIAASLLQSNGTDD